MSTVAEILSDAVGRWTLAPDRSTFEFRNRTMWGTMTVKGQFTEVRGEGRVTEAGAVSGRIDIVATSLHTGIGKRDEHLRSADFFDVEKFPTLRYRSKRIEKLGEAHFRVIGDLTIRDVTREVSVNVEYGGRGKDPWGNERAGFSASGAIDRKDFGLQWNQVLETGGVLVGDKIDIDLDIQAVKAAAVAAA
jgi:polyisoprenoid-binding protein YceI